MMRNFCRLVADRSGVAAVEMALVMPFLLVLMFGAFELGNYFLSEHVVQKGVRDAARYAARLPITDYDCGANTMSAETQVKRLARTGEPDGTTARLRGWTDDSMTTITISCDNSSAYGTGGIFTDFDDGAPVITVSATVPYETLFAFGLSATTLSLNAQSQAAVMGA